MADGVAFRIVARDGVARAGRLETPHGAVETPAFMPVASFGAVRGHTPDELRGAGAGLLLANTYHLHERPGEAVIAGLGGLHGFTGWRGPWLTDSGGYQVTSLADRARVDENGVRFRSTLDGRERQLTPERAVAIQEALGADVAMVLDECLSPEASSSGESERMRVATERTLRWAERCRAARRRPDQALFGIVQGGVSEKLRRWSARGTAALGFDGYAHGGFGLGETARQRLELVGLAQAELPDAAPRYLMGLGRPGDLVEAIAAGIDLFDCVLPTRNGRHGVVFTSAGTLKLRGARYRDDPAPPDPGCACPTCANHSRAYLRHLLHAREMLGSRLASLHNLHFYLGLLRRAREAIAAGEFEALRRAVTDVERDSAI